MTQTCDLEAERFSRDGYTVLRGFYDRATLINPVHKRARRIVASLCEKYGVDAPTATTDEAMGLGYLALDRASSAWSGKVYDAGMRIPALMRLDRDDDFFRALRPRSEPAFASRQDARQTHPALLRQPSRRSVHRRAKPSAPARAILPTDADWLPKGARVLYPMATSE